MTLISARPRITIGLPFYNGASFLPAMAQMATELTMMRFTHQRTEKLRRMVRGALGAALPGTDGWARRIPANRIAVPQ